MFNETFNRMFVLNYYHYEILQSLDIYNECHLTHLSI